MLRKIDFKEAWHIACESSDCKNCKVHHYCSTSLYQMSNENINDLINMAVNHSMAIEYYGIQVEAHTKPEDEG